MNFIENESADKLRGGYYTSAPIARFLARWVLGTRPRRILEPGCGDGGFFEALASEKRRLNPEVVGIELLAPEAHKAHQRARGLTLNASVLNTDFLEWSLKNDASGATFDAVLGNPPYVRYQYLSEDMQARAEKLFSLARLPFTRHTNLWVPFVISALRQLKPRGRLGMVIPSELLHVLHAQPLRDVLLRQCSRVVLVDPTELWFDNVLQGTVLLMAERAERDAALGQVGVVRVSGNAFLDGSPEELASGACLVPGSRLSGKWMSLFLDDRTQSLLHEATRHDRVRRFDEVADVDVGIVTGANDFFLVPDDTVDQYGLHCFAKAMFGRSEHVRGVIYDRKRHEDNRARGLPTNFIDFNDAKEKDALPASVQRYLALGESQGLPGRYKCRVRSPWYAVPSVWASPISMLKRSHDFPRLVLNDLGALTTDTAYRIRLLNGEAAPDVVAAFVNSLTMLTAEMQGRHYGGGVLELVPSEIEKLLLPLPRKRIRIDSVDELFLAGMPQDEILRRQDRSVLGDLGFSGADRDRLHAAWNKLRRRRQRSTDVAAES